MGIKAVKINLQTQEMPEQPHVLALPDGNGGWAFDETDIFKLEKEVLIPWMRENRFRQYRLSNDNKIVYLKEAS